MMVYFMRFYKRISLFFGLFCWLSLAMASSGEINIRHAELLPGDDAYTLNAEMEIRVDQAIEEAINKSVPLTFSVEFQIVKVRKYWFDDEITTIKKEIVLSYHALTRQYLVKQDAHQKSYSSLGEALQALSQVSEWKVVATKELEKGESYKAALLMRLDKTKLPKAIQVDAIGSEDWNLSSEVFEWSIKEIK
jgi:Domain of unknown function (DUF4390)